MKKIGIINQPISTLIAGLGHMDMVVVCDAGLPIPPGTNRIDLALVEGVPTFAQTVEAIQRELQVERLIIAKEMTVRSPKIFEFLKSSFPGLSIEQIPHEQFKDLTRHATAVIRTGEFTPYANVILVAGVVF